MTEEEAKQRWCPFARYVFGATDYPAGNRFEGVSETAKDAATRCLCIASACMAWRTARLGRVHEGDEYPTYSTVGYCGLAGAAQ